MTKVHHRWVHSPLRLSGCFSVRKYRGWGCGGTKGLWSSLRESVTKGILEVVEVWCGLLTGEEKERRGFVGVGSGTSRGVEYTEEEDGCQESTIFLYVCELTEDTDPEGRRRCRVSEN